MRLRGAHQRMPRSMKLRQKARKWARARRSRLRGGICGKHFSRLMRVTRRRSGISQ